MLFRKLKEAFLYYRIEKGLTEQELVYVYMNQIYLGNGAYGVEAAARAYLGKSAKYLTVAECATIAGLAKSPSKYSPRHNREAALDRRNYVLRRMYEDGKITQGEYEKATREELLLVDENLSYEKPDEDCLEHMRRYIENKCGVDALYKGGLHVHTTVRLPLADASQQGIRAPSVCIRKILDRRGKVLEEHLP